jgi:hypothetical protein
MSPRIRLRAAASAAVLACLVPLVGCDSTAGNGPTTTPTTQPTPPETSLERQQRLDFAAAEKSYREFMAEMDRIGKAGGSKTATPTMKMYAAGPYLKFYTEAARQQETRGVKYTADTLIGYVHTGTYSQQQLTLDVCEDNSDNKVIDKNGKVVGQGQILKRTLYARPAGERWKIWNGDEQGTATSCDEA